MEIAYATDLHGNEALFDKLFSFVRENGIFDVIIGGDICPRQGLTLDQGIDIQKRFLKDFFLPKIRELKDFSFYIMMGNDDFKVNYPILEDAEKKGIIKLINEKNQKIGWLKSYGYSYVNPTPFALKDWEKGDLIKGIAHGITTTKGKSSKSIKQDLAEIRDIDLFISHSPPFDTKLDQIHGKVHVGSRAIKEFIENKQPILSLHGHIHESPQISGNWIDKIGKTISINPGSLHLESILNLIIIPNRIDDIKLVKV